MGQRNEKPRTPSEVGFDWDVVLSDSLQHSVGIAVIVLDPIFVVDGLFDGHAILAFDCETVLCHTRRIVRKIKAGNLATY